MSEPDNIEPEELDEPARLHAADPEAPYGRKPDGTPYKMSPEQRAATGERLTAARRAAKGTRGRQFMAPAKTAGKKSSGASVDYRPGIIGLAQIPAFVLAIIGKRKPVFTLDAATITLHAPQLAEALNSTAQQEQWLADALDKILAVGPYGALLGAGVPLAMQFAVNHGRMEANADFGVYNAEDLMAILEKQSQS